jgi:DNA-binding response OmpR family regulator
MTGREDLFPGATLRRFILLLDLNGGPKPALALQPLLRQFGYNVCPAATEREAMEYLRVVVPSLIIADALSASDAVFDLLVRMKKEPGCARIPVILVSPPAPREGEGMAPCRLLSAHLRKPVPVDELYLAVQRVLERVPRQNIRIATCLKAVQGDIEGSEGYATELSERGMFFRTTAPQPVHAQVPVWIRTDEREIHLEARVIYRSVHDDGTFRGPGMGMQFITIRPEDQTHLRTFIQRRLQACLREGGR